MKQHTLKAPFSLQGKGLHTGLHIHATFLPAEENTGVRICRTDIEGRPTYEAVADYVTATERGTVLERGAWKVSTVEHALKLEALLCKSGQDRRHKCHKHNGRNADEKPPFQFVGIKAYAKRSNADYYEYRDKRRSCQGQDK